MIEVKARQSKVLPEFGKYPDEEEKPTEAE